jgi:molybdopterin molybdotransferase
MAASSLVEIDDARRIVLDALEPLPGETVALDLQALGRVLGEDVAAAEQIPAFDNSAMDGFAVRAQDLGGAGAASPVSLALVGESRAGRPAAAALAPGQAIGISTGAMMPAGADAVVRVEDTRSGEERDGHAVIEVLAAPAAAQDIRRAGEDVRAGETVLTAGTALGAAELGVLSSLGRAQVRVSRRPRLSVLVTGDELLSAQEPARPGGVRESNSLSVAALGRVAGAEVVHTARLPDEERATRAGIAAALEGAELAVICGGVSVGVHDHVRPSLAALGAHEAFWGLALRPGRPTWFGTVGGTPVFGLPGNPVSAMVTFVLLVAPALRALLGARDPLARAEAVLDSDYEKPAGRAHAVRCRMRTGEDGWHALPTGPQGSHILTSMLGADALALIPTAATRVRAGERVAVEPLRPWVALP